MSSISELISESIRKSDVLLLSQFPKLFLDEAEKKAIEWVVDYHREFANVPTPERFLDTEHGIYYSNRFAGSPISDLYNIALDKKRESYFFSKVHGFEEIVDSGKPIPPSLIVQLGNDLTTDGRTTYVEYSTIDRHVLYENMADDGVKFGWGNIDVESGGLIPGEFGILVARPGIGKTWLSCFLATKWYKEGKRVLFESFEMPDQAVIGRMDAIMGGFNAKLLRSPDMKAKDELIVKINEQIKYHDARGGKLLFPFQHGTDTPGRKTKKSMKATYIDSLYADIEEQKPDIVIADGIYMAKILGMAPNTLEWQKVKAASNMFKQIALDTGVIVLGTSQLKRSGKVDGFELDDVAYSDSLGQDADMMIAISKDSDLSNIIYLTMMKNRNGGPVASATMKIDYDHSTITEESWSS